MPGVGRPWHSACAPFEAEPTRSAHEYTYTLVPVPVPGPVLVPVPGPVLVPVPGPVLVPELDSRTEPCGIAAPASGNASTLQARLRERVRVRRTSCLVPGPVLVLCRKVDSRTEPCGIAAAASNNASTVDTTASASTSTRYLVLHAHYTCIVSSRHLIAYPTPCTPYSGPYPDFYSSSLLAPRT